MTGVYDPTMMKTSSKTKTRQEIVLRDYQTAFIEDDNQFRAVFAPRQSGKDLTVVCDIAAKEEGQALIILPIWKKENVQKFGNYIKALGVENRTELIGANRLGADPTQLGEFKWIYYTEPSFAPLITHHAIFPHILGKMTTYVGTPLAHRNSAILEFVIKTNASIHYWSPSDVFEPETIQYLINSLSPITFRNEIEALP